MISGRNPYSDYTVIFNGQYDAHTCYDQSRCETVTELIAWSSGTALAMPNQRLSDDHDREAQIGIESLLMSQVVWMGSKRANYQPFVIFVLVQAGCACNYANTSALPV